MRNAERRAISYWHDSLPDAPPPRAPLASDIRADVAIVGGGYTGLWTAYYLKRLDPSLSVAVLERHICGYGASGRNGGWCAAYLSGIDRWLDDPEQHEGALRLQRQMFDAVEQTGRVCATESIDCHFEHAGALEIAVNEGQLKRLREQLGRYRALGFTEEDYRLLDERETQETFRVEGALAALWFRHCAAIHPARLVCGLADTVERQGAVIHEGTPVLLVAPGELSTPNGRVRADRIVLATEGYTGGLAPHPRDHVPLHSLMVATAPLSREQAGLLGSPRRFCFANADRIVTYGQLTADGRIAFGCRGSYRYGSAIRHRFDTADPEFEKVRKTLLRFFPSLTGIRFTHAWGGAMGVTRKRQPSVLYDPDSRIGRAGGYFGNGVGASHLAGRTMADLLLGRDTERLRTPWVNNRAWDDPWEPEPLRWLGIRTARGLMHAADRAEYRKSSFAPLFDKALKMLVP